jgi:hypothetical protein
MSRIYLYKLATVNGGAPCVKDGLLTLAICKPMIRRRARIGDLLIGVAANGLFADNRLVYVARVTERLADGEYFRKAHYRGRPDCIYKWANEKFEPKAGAIYHGSQGDMDHDIGESPGYQRACTLISDQFCYFGTEGTADYRRAFPNFANVIDRLGRGHRVNFGDAAVREMEEMAERAMAQYRPASSRRPVEKSGRCIGRANQNNGVKRKKAGC